ncbi:hypothetical protein Bbelb_352900 [Branchiostoma belcheri]|nr:hypothetical protein Bbelb_352900 [Branchiostoma belcheri]
MQEQARPAHTTFTGQGDAPLPPVPRPPDYDTYNTSQGERRTSSDKRGDDKPTKLPNPSQPSRESKLPRDGGGYEDMKPHVNIPDVTETSTDRVRERSRSPIKAIRRKKAIPAASQAAGRGRKAKQPTASLPAIPGTSSRLESHNDDSLSIHPASGSESLDENDNDFRSCEAGVRISQPVFNWFKRQKCQTWRVKELRKAEKPHKLDAEQLEVVAAPRLQPSLGENCLTQRPIWQLLGMVCNQVTSFRRRLIHEWVDSRYKCLVDDMAQSEDDRLTIPSCKWLLGQDIIQKVEEIEKADKTVNKLNVTGSATNTKGCVQISATLRGRWGTWQSITTDPWILQTIQGLRLRLKGRPRQRFPPKEHVRSPEKSQLISQELQSLLKKGALIPTPSVEGEFLSHLFLVSKKTRGWCPVVTLRPLNQYVDAPHFKMEGLQDLKSLLIEDDYMAPIDIRDAYFHIPVHESFRRLLRFRWKGQIWEFQALPFGLNCAPRVFTKVTKPILAVIRSRGIRIAIYLDDILVLGRTFAQCKENVDFLGWDSLLQLTQGALNELSTWVECLESWNGKTFLPPPSQTCLTITSDSSLAGWGATCDHQKTGGRWTDEESKLHINELELKAALAFFGLKCFAKHLQNQHVTLRLDNTSAVAYINHQGGVQVSTPVYHSGRDLEVGLARKLHLSSEHLPGVFNTVADAESRSFNDHTEWTLRPDLFKAACRHLKF